MLYLKLKFNVKKGKFKFETNVENTGKFVQEFLRTQIGAGVDNRQCREANKYKINLQLDTTDDTWFIKHNCQNDGLSTGILLHYVSSLENC